jgi:hypothetical protein
MRVLEELQRARQEDLADLQQLPTSGLVAPSGCSPTARNCGWFATATCPHSPVGSIMTARPCSPPAVAG